ncbi:MAG: carotenoid biosynthesis protein [Parafilimonas sp.]|nr:carotenoid biosynthesis protein [Parafilimonas sp.]
MNRKRLVQNIALFIALLFHVCGLIGILFTSYRDWFIQNTPINLLVITGLLIITHPQKNKGFFLFFIAACVAGFAAEVIGINTGLLFGHYTYGNILGTKLFDVPFIIAINWFMIIYCTGMVTQSYENYMIKKLDERGMAINKRMLLASFVIDAACLAFLFDWVMEPVASKLGFWQWEHNEIPNSNYVTWVLISALLLAIFRKLNNNSRNLFAVNLFIIQLLFFLVLRTFL